METLIVIIGLGVLAVPALYAVAVHEYRRKRKS